ncbi:MAG: CBS domain-containing protein, partial [Chlamydiota bacterium]|nr:CBS domain-containing protein [Chlamydiota bacterium]
ETDVVRKILGKDVDWKDPVSKYMSGNPLVLNLNDSVGKAMDIMGENYLYHVPLADGNNDITGVLTVRTIIRFLSEFYPTEVYNLPPKSDQIMDTPEGG